MRRTLLVLGALCWFGFAGVFGLILVDWYQAGAGGYGFGLVISSGTVLLGLAHLLGLLGAIGVCVLFGLGLLAHALLPPAAGAAPKTSSPRA